MYLLENNQDNINWDNLLENQNEIEILENNKEKIKWFFLSKNSLIHKEKWLILKKWKI